MDPLHASTTLSVSDQHDDRLYIEIVDDYETHDVRSQPKSPVYESLSNTTKATRRSQRSSPYEELNNDVWKEIYPVNTKPSAAIQPQPSSAVSYQRNAKQIHIPISLKHNETRDVSSKTPSCLDYGNLVNKAPVVKSKEGQTSHPAKSSYGGNSKTLEFVSKTNCENPPKENKTSPGRDEHDFIEHFEYLSGCQLSLQMVKGEHDNIPSSTSRPLTVAPLVIYEPLNRMSNSNYGKIVSRWTCTQVAKI